MQGFRFSSAKTAATYKSETEGIVDLERTSEGISRSVSNLRYVEMCSRVPVFSFSKRNDEQVPTSLIQNLPTMNGRCTGPHFPGRKEGQCKTHTTCVPERK
eukprot:2371577-Rhodomonas_salina.2